MRPHAYSFRGVLKRFPGPGGWHFITVPRKLAQQLRQQYRPNHGGWGSLRVEVIVGGTSWKTSIFWNREVSYWLFVKADVRKRENLAVGKAVRVHFALLNV